MKFKQTLAIILSATLLSACSTIETARQAQGTGEKMVFSETTEKMWPVILNAVTATKGTIKEKNEKSCTVLASYGMTLLSWGEKVGVFCKPTHNGTEVEVVTKASLKNNITAVKRAPKIFKVISESVQK